MQAYLCRCGLKVLSLDRAETFGGGLATVQNPRQTGFLHNTHSFFHRALTAMPWYLDLQLEEQGAKYVEPELNVALILKDGKSLQWWTDFERTYESLCQLSRRFIRSSHDIKPWAPRCALHNWRPFAARFHQLCGGRSL